MTSLYPKTTKNQGNREAEPWCGLECLPVCPFSCSVMDSLGFVLSAGSSVRPGNGRTIIDPDWLRRNKASRRMYFGRGMDSIVDPSRASPCFLSRARLLHDWVPLDRASQVRNASPTNFHRSYKMSQTMDWSTNLPLRLVPLLPKRVIGWCRCLVG